MKRALILLGGMLGFGGSLSSRAQTTVVTTVMTTADAAGYFAALRGGQPAGKEKAAAGGKPPGVPAILRWNNGESLAGAVGNAGEESMTWATPAFDEPLALAWHALHRVDQPGADRLPTEPFAFTLRDGSYLYGDLTGVSADGVSLHSAAHGDLTLRREAVLNARRIRYQRLLFAGPAGDAGWSVATNEDSNLNQRRGNSGSGRLETLGKVPTMRTGPGGSLALPFFDRAARLRLSLPDRVDAEFSVSTLERPAFSFALEGAKRRLRVETWGDQLVLAAGTGFTLVRTLGPEDRRVALRVCWDSGTGACKVYTPEGSLLQQWTAPEEKAGNAAGVTLHNKGRALGLDFLRMREWNGEAPPAVANPAQPRVCLDDGSVVAGSVRALEDGELVVAAVGDGPPVRVSLTEVDAVDFAGAVSSKAGAGTTLTLADGTFLREKSPPSRTARRRCTPGLPTRRCQPRSTRGGSCSCGCPRPADAKPEGPLKTQDRLVLGDVTLHGQLVVIGDAVPHWRPVGGTRLSTPARSLPSEIVRAGVAGQLTPDGLCLFHTRAGDAIPGILHGLDRKEVEFESPVVAATSLPTEDLEAVQFDVSTGGSVRGFDAPGWQVIKGPKQDTIQGDKVNLADGTVVGHPAVMTNGEVQFRYDTVNFSCVRLRMFCDLSDPTQGINLMLFRSGSAMSVGIEPADGQFSAQNRFTMKPGPTTVRLVIDDRNVRCYLNDSLGETVPLPVARRAGSGLIIEPAGLWGNAVESVTLSGFAASAEPGQAFLPVVNAGAKTQALTVPRFRKEDPPRQALLAANGDLLRGEIEAITNTQFGFRVGLEELHVPRDRVKAVVALQKPTDAAPAAPPEEDAVHKALGHPMGQRFWYTRANLRILVSVLEREVPELKFKLPNDADDQYAQYHFEAPTIGDNLDNICELFGLHYQIEKGVIVISTRVPALATDLARTVYWLKPGSFDEKDPAEAVLTAKGVTFPAGGSARWQAGAQCLEVVNTPENQAKVVGLLNRDFGGILGSPTHWLRLTNGGRLGLAVDQFGPDVIRGTHPLYGKCTVPLAQVYAIRNTLPAETAAGRSVGGWQLVYAPEPVLPESGGEGSALLGKAAPTFKLKMLGGGEDFDLGKEKGHVVVLDFWATWCGPCIRSLPGLIETMAQFPADRVKFVALNQAEAPEQVKRFLETHGWKLAVALDAGQTVARQYGVDGIPHTVIVGPDGKVAWVKTGYTEDGDEQAAAAVKKLLAPATAAPATTPAAGLSASTADGAPTAEVAQK